MNNVTFGIFFLKKVGGIDEEIRLLSVNNCEVGDLWDLIRRFFYFCVRLKFFIVKLKFCLMV